MVPWSTRVSPKRHLHRFSRFAGLTNVTNRQTDKLTDSHTHTQTDHATPYAATARILCNACDEAWNGANKRVNIGVPSPAKIERSETGAETGNGRHLAPASPSYWEPRRPSSSPHVALAAASGLPLWLASRNHSCTVEDGIGYVMHSLHASHFSWRLPCFCPAISSPVLYYQVFTS